MKPDTPKGKYIFETLVLFRLRQRKEKKQDYHWTIVYAEVQYELLRLSTTPNQAQKQFQDALIYGKNYYEGKYDNK